MKIPKNNSGDGTYSDLVDIGGRKLYYKCSVNDQPTVVMEAGAGATSEMWQFVSEAVATFTQVCIYDRANLGSSDQAPKPRTAYDMAVDLSVLLVHTGIPGPYILVGASFGGLVVRLFAAHHLKDVAGMVLVDSTHPDQITLSANYFPPPGEGNEAVRQLRAWVTTIDPETHPEGIIFETSLREVKETSVMGGLGNIPLVVLSRGTSIQHDFPGLPPDLAMKLDATWLDAQRDLTRLSTNSVHQVATKSGHNIASDEPELVVEAIRHIVNAVREQHSF